MPLQAQKCQPASLPKQGEAMLAHKCSLRPMHAHRARMGTDMLLHVHLHLKTLYMRFHCVQRSTSRVRCKHESHLSHPGLLDKPFRST